MKISFALILLVVASASAAKYKQNEQTLEISLWTEDHHEMKRVRKSDNGFDTDSLPKVKLVLGTFSDEDAMVKGLEDHVGYTGVLIGVGIGVLLLFVILILIIVILTIVIIKLKRKTVGNRIVQN